MDVVWFMALAITCVGLGLKQWLMCGVRAVTGLMAMV